MLTKKNYQKTKQAVRLQAQIEKAQVRFSTKPVVEEFFTLNQMANIARPGLALFSIITGFGFLFYQLASNLPWWVSFGLALALLVVLEVAKGEASSLVFRRLYSYGLTGLNMALLLFAFATYAASVFLSVNGAKELYQRLDKTEALTKTDTQKKLDSLGRAYDGKISQLQAQQKDFEKSVSWQGKINISDKTVSNTIASYTARLDSLESEKRRILGGVANDGRASLESVREANGFNIVFWLSLSCVIEFLIFLALWFGVWYQWQVAQESILFAAEPDAQHQREAYQFLQSVSIPVTEKTLSPGLPIARATGLAPGLENQVFLRENQEKGQALPKPKKQKKVKKPLDLGELEGDFRAGNFDARVLLQKHRLNVNQLQNHIDRWKKEQGIK